MDCIDDEIPAWIGKEMIFPRESITLREELGHGNFGVIRKARVRLGKSEFPVAVKSTRHVWLNNTDIPLPFRKDVEALIDEAKSMNAVGKYNENIVNLQGVCFDKPDGRNLRNFYILLEYCVNGDLKSFLSKHESEFKLSLALWNDNINGSTSSKPVDGNNYDTEQLIIWSFQIASGMEFLSTRAIYHGDLACRNILLTETLVAKISDFGLSRRLYDKLSSDVKSDDALPWRWSAIEVLKLQEYSLHSDIWSFGIVLWEIFQLGKEPYLIEGLDIYTLRDMLCDGVRLETPFYAPSYISYYMKECWKEERDERPCYSSFLHSLENLYELKASSDSEALSENTCASRVKSRYLKYASLAFHEDSVENRFRKIRNLRIKQPTNERQDSDEKCQYAIIDTKRMAAFEAVSLLNRSGHDETKIESDIDETGDKPYLIRLSGKTKLIGLLALSIMIISTLVIVSTNQYGPKAMDYIRINGTDTSALLSTSIPSVDCKISEWSVWSTCSKSCDNGYQTRSRQILISPQNGGKHCPKGYDKNQFTYCNTMPCPVSCGNHQMNSCLLFPQGHCASWCDGVYCMWDGSKCIVKEEKESKECKTESGPSTNHTCIFPFVFNGKIYNGCAHDADGFWCSTNVDSNGTHIGELGNWGICGPNCFDGIDKQRWYIGHKHQDCTTTCHINGLICTEDEMWKHNSDVDGPEKLANILKQKLGSTSFPLCSGKFGNETDIPSISTTWSVNECLHSSPGRQKERFDCGRIPNTPDQRLCYCHEA